MHEADGKQTFIDRKPTYKPYQHPEVVESDSIEQFPAKQSNFSDKDFTQQR